MAASIRLHGCPAHPQRKAAALCTSYRAATPAHAAAGARLGRSLWGRLRSLRLHYSWHAPAINTCLFVSGSQAPEQAISPVCASVQRAARGDEHSRPHAVRCVPRRWSHRSHAFRAPTHADVNRVARLAQPAPRAVSTGTCTQGHQHRQPRVAAFASRHRSQSLPPYGPS